MLARFRAKLVLLAVGALVASVANAFDKEDETFKDRASFVPVRQYKALPGKVVGVLVSDVQEVMNAEGHKGPATALCFSSGGESYHWLYIPVQVRPQIGGMRLKAGPDGKTVKRFDNLSLADPRSLKEWGIHRPFALVELEVNAGLGSP